MQTFVHRSLVSRLGLALVLLAAGAGACTDAPEPQRKSMNFKIDRELLGLSFQTETFAMRVPKGWDHVSFNELFAERRYRAEGTEDERLAPLVAAVYHEEGGQGTLVILQYKDELAPREEKRIVGRETQSLRAIANEGELKEAFFTYAGYDFDQLVLAGAEQVITKLFLRRPDSPMYCLEFVMPRMEFAAAFPAIESSIGSIGIPLNPTDKKPREGGQ